MRSIRQEEEFTKQLAGLKVNYKRLDEALIYVNDALCNSPEIFPPITGTSLRRLRLSNFPGVPPLSIFFIYDDEYVYLISADLIETEL